MILLKLIYTWFKCLPTFIEIEHNPAKRRHVQHTLGYKIMSISTTIVGFIILFFLYMYDKW